MYKKTTKWVNAILDVNAMDYGSLVASYAGEPTYLELIRQMDGKEIMVCLNDYEILDNLVKTEWFTFRLKGRRKEWDIPGFCIKKPKQWKN